MTDIIGKIIDGVHRFLDPRFSLTLLLGSATIYYGPGPLVTLRARWPDIELYAIGVGAFSAASLSVWVIIGLGKAFSTAAGHISTSRAESGKHRAVEKALRSLSPEQRALLAIYLANAYPDRQYLPNVDPLVVGMRDKGILCHTPYVVSYEDGHGCLMTAHGVTDAVRRHMRGREVEFLSGITKKAAEVVRQEIIEPANSGRISR